MTAWARAECGALDPVALHVSVVEVEHSAAVITISLLVAEVDDNEIALTATHGPRKPVLACDKQRPTSVMGQKASGWPEEWQRVGGAGIGAILTCVDAQMRISGRRKCHPCEGPQEQRFGAAGPARGGHSALSPLRARRFWRCLGAPLLLREMTQRLRGLDGFMIVPRGSPEIRYNLARTCPPYFSASSRRAAAAASPETTHECLPWQRHLPARPSAASPPWTPARHPPSRRRSLPELAKCARPGLHSGSPDCIPSVH